MPSAALAPTLCLPPVLVVGQGPSRLAATRAGLSRCRLANPVVGLRHAAATRAYVAGHAALQARRTPTRDVAGDHGAAPLPVVVVTDLTLPDGSGLDVLRLFRHHLVLRPIPVITVAEADPAPGSAAESAIAEAHELGAAAVLSPHLADAVLGSVIRDLEMPWTIGAQGVPA